MRYYVPIFCLLTCSSVFAQNVTVTPQTKAQSHLRSAQKAAEDVWAERDEAEAKAVESRSYRLWKNVRKKKKFEAKFVRIEAGYVTVKSKVDGKLYDVPLSSLDEESKKYIRGIVRPTKIKK